MDRPRRPRSHGKSHRRHGRIRRRRIPHDRTFLPLCPFKRCPHLTRAPPRQKALLAKGAKVYVLGRNKDLFDAACDRLASEQPDIVARPLFIHLDLASRSSPRTAARELSSKEPSLDVLFCNAGIMVPPSGARTNEGYDLQWATNVMGHWILTTALLPLLVNVYDSSQGQAKARVVHTSSSGHWFAPRQGVEGESLKPEGAPRLNNWALYGQVRHG